MLASCFVFLETKDVVRASHVCRAWRSTALSFPVLWSNIRLVSAFFASGSQKRRIANLKLLSTALVRAGHHPVDLTFCSPLLPSVVTPILNEHMHHLRSLSWTSIAPVVFVQPAPLLEYLSCSRLDPTPGDLFGGSAPRLRTLAVQRRLCLPETCLALSNVTSLTAGAPRRDNHLAAQSLARIFLLMPRLVTLKVFGLRQETCHYLPKGPAPNTLQRVTLWAVSNISAFDCDVATPVAAWRTPNHNLQHIELRMSLASSQTAHMNLIFEDAASLSIDMEDGSIRLLATTTSDSQLQTRDVTFLLEMHGADVQSAPGELSGLLRRHIAHLQHVHTLRAPAAVLSAEVLLAMPHLASLTAVVHKWRPSLHHGDYDPRPWPNVPFSCSGLSCLQHIPSVLALTSLTVHIDAPLNHPEYPAVWVTRDDAEAIVSAIANSLCSRGTTQETIGVEFTGFPSALVKDIKLPDLEGYSISFKDVEE